MSIAEVSILPPAIQFPQPQPESHSHPDRRRERKLRRLVAAVVCGSRSRAVDMTVAPATYTPRTPPRLRVVPSMNSWHSRNY